MPRAFAQRQRSSRAPVSVLTPEDVRSEQSRAARRGLPCFAMKTTRVLGAAILFLLSACSSASSDDGGGPAITPDPPAVTPDPVAVTPPVFGTCPVGYDAECALIDVPLDHSNEAGESIKIHIARHRASVPATRQIWLLSGGPGQAGDVFLATVKKLAVRIPDADIYVIDHRGTGYSHRLTCSQQDVPGSNGGYVLDPDEALDCLAELKQTGDYARLPFFTTAQAARDVVSAVQATRTADQKVYVWGGSYGTHWAHRVLQVAPDLAAGIVFDGFMTPLHFSFVDYDHGVEEATTLYAAGCTADASCSSHIGGDALVKARAILQGLRTKPCAGVDRDLARTYLSAFMDGWSSRSWVFPLLHRLERCSADDQAAVNKLLTAYTKALQGGDLPTTTDDYRSSGVLQYNIALSELWNTPGRPDPTKEELLASAEAQTFLAGRSYPASIIDLRKAWPLPPNDWEDLPVPVPTKTALLWLAGGLDTRTPPAQAKQVTSLYDARSFVLLPGASHTPASASPLASDPKSSCGQQIVERFIGKDQLDASCISEMLSPVYEATSAASASTWWETPDDWGDGTPKMVIAGGSSAFEDARIDPSFASRLALRRAHSLGR